jgi:hypothetical protein
MAHGHTKIDSKGACIYCGRSDVFLTNEHIVPLSIGGQIVILKASCRDCEKITTKFERDVAREMWGDARISYNAPSRRKRDRKTHIVLPDPHGYGKGIKVPYSEYPAPMIFYKMHPAGILQGFPEDLDISSKWEFVAITDEKKLKAFEAKYPGRLTAKFRHVPESFARMIAKIGYGNALFQLDPSDFRPICLPYILGEKKNASFIVGGSFSIADPIPDVGYSLRTACFGNSERIIIFSEVRLIANNHTPTYHVIVGDVTGREKIEKVIGKFGPGEFKLLQISPSAPTFANEAHWMPQVWPLNL